MEVWLFCKTLFHSSTYSHDSVLPAQTVRQAARPRMLHNASAHLHIYEPSRRRQQSPFSERWCLVFLSRLFLHLPSDTHAISARDHFHLKLNIAQPPITIHVMNHFPLPTTGGSQKLLYFFLGKFSGNSVKVLAVRKGLLFTVCHCCCHRNRF